jgi:ABC-type antimicrobial peptide transport system permease subunit
VATLGDLRRLPRVLAGFLAVLVVAALTHPLVLLVRRRRRDIGVLRAVGFTRRQVGAAVVVAALTTAVVGLAVGVPLGLAAGRVIWAELAASVGVAGDIAVPGAALVVLPGAVVLVALLVAALPARRAVRLPPAAAVRSE